MPQAVTIESLPEAFEVIKEMQAEGYTRGEDYRPASRAALARILEDGMAVSLDRHLRKMARRGEADRRNGTYSRHLLTELGDIELCVPRTRRFSSFKVVRALGVAGVFAIKPSVTDRSFHTVVSVVGDFWQSPYGLVWIGGLKVARENPVLGVGLKNLRTTCRTVVYGSPDKAGPECSLHPHNFYIEWLSEAGSIGLFGFLVLITLWTRHFLARAGTWRSDGLAVGTVVAVITFLWPIATTMGFFTNWHAALFWFVLGWALAVTGERSVAPTPRSEAGGATRVPGKPV